MKRGTLSKVCLLMNFYQTKRRAQFNTGEWAGPVPIAWMEEEEYYCIIRFPELPLFDAYNSVDFEAWERDLMVEMGAELQEMLCERGLYQDRDTLDLVVNGQR